MIGVRLLQRISRERRLLLIGFSKIKATPMTKIRMRLRMSRTAMAESRLARSMS